MSTKPTEPEAPTYELTPPLDTWGLVEVDFRRVAGRVLEQLVAGEDFIRIDVPAVGDAEAFTTWVAASTVTTITPLDEEAARGFAAKFAEGTGYPWVLS